VAVTVKLAFHLPLVPILLMRGAVTPLSHACIRSDVLIKHRGNFTFALRLILS
jgi:hypothetical protein